MGIGSILLERGLISDDQLTQAIVDQNRTGERLDHVMARLGFVSSGLVLEAIGQRFAMQIVDHFNGLRSAIRRGTQERSFKATTPVPRSEGRC